MICFNLLFIRLFKSCDLSYGLPWLSLVFFSLFIHFFLQHFID